MTAAFTVIQSEPFINALNETRVNYTTRCTLDGQYADHFVCGTAAQAKAIGRDWVKRHTPDLVAASGTTTTDVLATVKELRARARKTPQAARNGHYQMATRRMNDAALFASKNIDYAIQCCWEARHHLNEAFDA